MGKKKTDEGYGEGLVKLDFDDDALLDEEEMTARLMERFNSPNYEPPKLPGVATELMALAQNPDVTIADIVSLLEKDTMLTGQIMKLVQSAIYSGQTEITSLNQALIRIGLNSLRDVVFQASMNMRVFRADAYADTMNRLRRHSAFTGYVARAICKYTKIEGEYAFLCGLMHDIGIAAILIALSDTGPKKKAPDLVAIWPAIDRVHAQAGQLIAGLWELPETISVVLGAHHQVMIEGTANPLAATVCLAESIAHERGFGLVPDGEEDVEGVGEIEVACLQSHSGVDLSMDKTLEQAKEALGISESQLSQVRSDCEEIEAAIV